MLLLLRLKMSSKESIKVFDDRKIRSLWDDDTEEWYFSIVDIVGVLTASPNPRKYWSVLKTRLKKEGSELATNCSQLKMTATDGKKYKTDCVDTEQLFRLIQSIPSPKAEPFKQWMAEVANERLNQIQDPELSIEQAMTDYKRLGYSDKWINQRLKSIEIRKELTDEWKNHGLEEGVQFATLTDTFEQHKETAQQGGEIALNARLELEAKTRKKVVSPLSAKDGIMLDEPNYKQEIENG